MDISLSRNEVKTGKVDIETWDTDPWNNFCDPHWKLMCRKKWHLGTSGISPPPEIALATHFYARHGFKTTPVVLPADWETKRSLLPSLVSSLNSRYQSRSEKAKKGLASTLITASTSVLYPKPVSSENWFRFSLNQPNKKRWNATLVNVMKHLPNKVFLS